MVYDVIAMPYDAITLHIADLKAQNNKYTS